MEDYMATVASRHPAEQVTPQDGSADSLDSTRSMLSRQRAARLVKSVRRVVMHSDTALAT